jgi:hypothetical protein
MAVDIDRFAVLAITREIRNVVLAIEFLDSPHDGVERAIIRLETNHSGILNFRCCVFG